MELESPEYEELTKQLDAKRIRLDKINKERKELQNKIKNLEKEESSLFIEMGNLIDDYCTKREGKPWKKIKY